MSNLLPPVSPYPEDSVYAVHTGFKTGVLQYARFRSAVNGYEARKVRWAIFDDAKDAAQFVKTGECPLGVTPIASSSGDPERLGAARDKPTKVASSSKARVAPTPPTPAGSLLTPDASPETESPPKPFSGFSRQRIPSDTAVRLTVSQPPPAPRKPTAAAVSPEDEEDEDDEGGDTEPEDDDEVPAVTRPLPGQSRTPAASSQATGRAPAKTLSMSEKIALALRQSKSVGELPDEITDATDENPFASTSASTSKPAPAKSTSRAGASSPTKMGPPSTSAAAQTTPSLSSTQSPASRSQPVQRTTAITVNPPARAPITPAPSRTNTVSVPPQAPTAPSPATPPPTTPAHRTRAAPQTGLVLRTDPAPRVPATEPIPRVPEFKPRPEPPHGHYRMCHGCQGTGWIATPESATTPAPDHSVGSIPTPTHTRTRTRPRPKTAAGVTGSESEGNARERGGLRIQSRGPDAAVSALGGIGPHRRTKSSRSVSEGLLERKRRDKGKGKAIDVDAMDVDAESPIAGPSTLSYAYLIYALILFILLQYEAVFRFLCLVYRYA